MPRLYVTFLILIPRVSKQEKITLYLFFTKTNFLFLTKIVMKVYYPKYITPDIYHQYKKAKGGYGGLFSLTFHTDLASEQFFDALEAAKGPSLGTNFTLACPYTILAHYVELDWAAQYGVEKG